ncbi:MAG: hypothetical protein WBW80_23140 [Acidimicrobiales bacterium]
MTTTSIDPCKVNTAQYNRVYHIIERALFPDRYPGLVNAEVVRRTRAVFDALAAAGSKDPGQGRSVT